MLWLPRQVRQLLLDFTGLKDVNSPRAQTFVYVLIGVYLTPTTLDTNKVGGKDDVGLPVDSCPDSGRIGYVLG